MGSSAGSEGEGVWVCGCVVRVKVWAAVLGVKVRVCGQG